MLLSAIRCRPLRPSLPHLARLATAPASRRSRALPLALGAGSAACCAFATQRIAAASRLQPPPPSEVEHSSSSAYTSSLSKMPKLSLVLKLLWRCGELSFFLGPMLFWYALRKIPLAGERWVTRQALFKRLVRALARCGPVGIKWGQWASTRYDLFEDDFCEAIGQLTNDAPSHPFAVTRHAVERSFGQPIEELFERFEHEPLASGSIGQVHLATLRRDGATVAVKVQHPNLPERMALDMAILRLMADLCSLLFPQLRIGETADQFATNFEMQLDFRDEARFLRQFRRNYSGQFWSAICTFPQPTEGLVSQDVLVETFEAGESVATFLKRNGDRAINCWRKLENGEWQMERQDSEGWEDSDENAMRSSIALCGVQSYLKMMIWDNLIHADLHPGNVLIRMEDIGPLARLQRWIVLGDSSARVPHIVFLDAGLAASFPQQIFKSVNSFFDAIVQTDGVNIGRSILGLAPSQPNVADPDAFIQEVAAKCEQQKNEFIVGAGNPGKNIRSYMESVRHHGVVLDPTVMVALMSMMVLEGWQSRLDPQISIMECLAEATGGGMFGRMTRLNQLLQDTRETLSRAFGMS